MLSRSALAILQSMKCRHRVPPRLLRLLRLIGGDTARRERRGTMSYYRSPACADRHSCVVTVPLPQQRASFIGGCLWFEPSAYSQDAEVAVEF